MNSAVSAASSNIVFVVFMAKRPLPLARPKPIVGPVIERKYMMTDAEEKEARIAQAGIRALAEAASRRAAEGPLELPPERGGREGPEPVRYGDWELAGRAIDF
jgi:hypothetical protein